MITDESTAKKDQHMHKLPEYHAFRAGREEGTVQVMVSIDGNTRMVPWIRMEPQTLARLLEAFFAGDLRFMSFDEHPKRLIGMSVKSDGKPPVVRLTARSLVEGDGFPQEWEIADPQLFGAPPWNGQMK
ncbi:MAG: hypothetical protein H5U17_00630 [Defluviimonas sp.]|nr:hypothetical protein [Defluviimonas sp.]